MGWDADLYYNHSGNTSGTMQSRTYIGKLEVRSLGEILQEWSVVND